MNNPLEESERRPFLAQRARACACASSHRHTHTVGASCGNGKRSESPRPLIHYSPQHACTRACSGLVLYVTYTHTHTQWGNLREGELVLYVTDYEAASAGPGRARAGLDPGLAQSKATVHVYGVASSAAAAGGGPGKPKVLVVGQHGYTAGAVWVVAKLVAVTRQLVVCTPTDCPPPGS